MTRSCVIYTRISDDREGTSVGVQNQEKACRERANSEGWTVTRVFVDNDRGASSKSRKTRPEYEAMLALVRSGQVDHVLAYSTSRLTRRPRQLEDWLDLHEQGKTKVAFVSGQASDWSTSQGRAIARTLAAFDASEAEQISERVTFRLANAARAGKRHSTGKRAFGWQLDGITPEPREAEALADATAKIIKGASLHSICQAWNAAGITSTMGNPWTHTTLRLLLKRAANCGLTRYQGEILTDDHGKPIMGEWAPLVSVKQYETLLSVFADPARRSAPSNDTRHLCGGLITCGVCGSKMRSATAGVTTKRSWQYRCTGLSCGNSIIMKYVDGKVRAGILAEFLYSPSDGTASGNDRLTDLYARLRKITETQAEILSLIGEVLSAADARPRLAVLKADQDRINTEIQAELSRDADAAMQSEAVRELLGGVHSMFNQWGKAALTRGGKRTVEDLGNRWDNLAIADKRRIISSRLNVTINKGRGTARVDVKHKNGRDYSAEIREAIKQLPPLTEDDYAFYASQHQD